MPEPTNDELLKKLDEISLHLKNLDQRDHNRTIWSWMKSTIGVVMFVVALFSSWYLVNNLGEIMKLVVQESAKQSQEAVKSGSENFLKQIQGFFQGETSSSSSTRARPRPAATQK